jgi:integrase
MALYKPRKSRYWWYKFVWKTELIRESTKQTNKRVAEQIQAARKTQLAKHEVGIRDRKPSPTLQAFLKNSFLPFVEATKRDQPNTATFYRNRVSKLLKDATLTTMNLETISAESITAYVCRLREKEPEIAVATINRDLATLRRALRLASDWGELVTKQPKICLLAGEVGRERVLNVQEETAYLNEASPLLRTVATIILDCGLRPDEVYRLRWDANYRAGRITIHTGKTKAARRSVSVTPRVAALLEMWRTEPATEWIFGAPSKACHINQSSIKKQHLKAIKASGVPWFVPYDLRHTCLTRWARYLDPFTLKKLAGHESLETTMKYIHLNEVDSEARLLEARKKIDSDRTEVQGGHTFGHTTEEGEISRASQLSKPNDFNDFWRARRGSNSRPIDSKSIALSN